MTGNQIREAFLRYFEQKGHRIVKSSPLLPGNDPTLLFTNAGMNQFKEVFLGNEKRDYVRAASSQKCVRAGGKHNDLDEVGRTARHQTFFEMLGNFSFGDYFKEEAIRFAWELLVDVFKLPVERLWFSVYETDDEAFELWKKAGAPEDRILRFGAKDNFWEMGETGPCGPCSEIHYFMGDDLSQNRAEFVNGPGDTTIEIWNLVFMQYDRDASGTLNPLPRPSVDTGMGLERVTAVLQGVHTNYDTDLIMPIVKCISDLCGKPYQADTEDGFSMRVVADHARATAFLIADGIFPGNEGRAYVLRKIMRRALWHGHRLGLASPFFHRVTHFVTELMGAAFPELHDSHRTIERVVTTEDRLFSSTLSQGVKRLEEMIARTEGNVLGGHDAFVLYDTFGLREDLIGYIVEQGHREVDWAGFQAEMAQQRERARESWKGATLARQAREVHTALASRLRTEFIGYTDTTREKARVAAIVVDDAERPLLQAGETGEVVLDVTPFYAESGGQMGDTGTLESEQARALVNETVAPVAGLSVHRVTVELGELRVGDLVRAQVDTDRRDRIRANHTGTHLLHAALREVLGPHVKQAGSLVAPDRFRFDFTHFTALQPEEIQEVERLVNEQILRNSPLSTDLMDLDKAVETGAMALFGEKYADRVRVVTVPGFSRELCGGTHCHATGDIGLLKIVSDSSISSGVRRIEALTGVGAFDRFRTLEGWLGETAELLKTSQEAVPAHVERLQHQLKAAHRELEALKLKVAAQSAGEAAGRARDIKGVKVVAQRTHDLDPGARRTIADDLLNRIHSGVVVIGQAEADKASLIVRVSQDQVGRLHAGRLVKELSEMLGGRGGGRPDLAEAGGRDVARLDEVLEAAYGLVERALGA